MKYMFLLYGDESAGETPAELTDERAAQWGEFHQVAESSGKLVSWHSMVPSASAVTVRPDKESFIETDGPYAETKEQLGGFYILECTGITEALTFARKMPCSAYGMIEVRQMLGENASNIQD